MNSALNRNFSAIEKLMLVTIKLQMLHKQSYCNMSHFKSKPMMISTKPKIEGTSAKTVTLSMQNTALATNIYKLNPYLDMPCILSKPVGK